MVPRTEEHKALWLRLDERWCGQSMLPVRFLLPFLLDESPAFQIILFRGATILFTGLEVLGTFVVTLGLLPWTSIGWLWFGAVLKIGGIAAATISQNEAGNLWLLQLNQALKRLRTHGAEIRVMLADRGLTEGEINAMQGLPGEIYNTEVNSYSRLQALMVGIPLACAFGLAVAGETLTAVMVALIGVTTGPLTEFFYQKRVRVVDDRIRLGRATGVDSYLDVALEQNARIMFVVSSLSQLPLLLFLVRYAYGLGGDILASYYGITQGLVGLTSSLSFQKNRVFSQRASESARHLLEALASPSLLISHRSWELHRESLNTMLAAPINNGVVLEKFAVSSTYPRRLPPLDTVLESGTCTLLQAPSGRGKTLLMLALAHLVDHTGSMLFVKDGVVVDAHTLSDDELRQAVFARREADLDRASRLVDLFRPYCRARLDALYQSMRRNWGATLAEVAWAASDARLERQLRTGQGALPQGMKRSLEELRAARLKLINQLLAEEGLQTSSDKSFGSLSSGERRRILALMALTTAEVTPSLRLLILDEPFANLDVDSIHSQVSVIERILALGRSVFVISHTLPEELHTTLLTPYGKEAP